jgi:hypothetical protein
LLTRSVPRGRVKQERAAADLPGGFRSVVRLGRAREPVRCQGRRVLESSDATARYPTCTARAGPSEARVACRHRADDPRALVVPSDRVARPANQSRNAKWAVARRSSRPPRGSEDARTSSTPMSVRGSITHVWPAGDRCRPHRQRPGDQRCCTLTPRPVQHGNTARVWSSAGGSLSWAWGVARDLGGTTHVWCHLPRDHPPAG